MERKGPNLDLECGSKEELKSLNQFCRHLALKPMRWLQDEHLADAFTFTHCLPVHGNKQTSSVFVFAFIAAHHNNRMCTLHLNPSIQLSIALERKHSKQSDVEQNGHTPVYTCSVRLNSCSHLCYDSQLEDYKCAGNGSSTFYDWMENPISHQA